MKSLYGAILIWFAILLALSTAVILFSAPMAALRFSGRGGPIDRTHFVFLRQAREALDTRGKAGLEQYLNGLAAQLPARYHLLDSTYRDLVTGDDRTRLAEAGAARWIVARIEGGLVRTYSENGFHLVSVIQPRGGSGAGSLPFVLLVAAVAAALCWLFAARLASPVRELSRTMDAFGSGRTAVRSAIRRDDEIGGLARSFNQMADRIEALVTSERRLLQDVSHELQSPLARLAIAVKLLRNAEDRDAAAARLQKEIDRLSRMIAGLLDISRAEGDPAARHTVPVDLRALLEDIAEDCRLEADAKRCHFDVAFAAITIVGDEELLRRAFENVLRNAVRYSPAGAGIDVRLSAKEALAEVTIRDRGPGVPKESLERIFAPFYRVEESRDPAMGGAGIGLSLAKRAVLLHRGSIEASNAGPGLCVVVRLPIAGPTAGT